MDKFRYGLSAIAVSLLSAASVAFANGSYGQGNRETSQVSQSSPSSQAGSQSSQAEAGRSGSSGQMGQSGSTAQSGAQGSSATDQSGSPSQSGARGEKGTGREQGAAGQKGSSGQSVVYMLIPIQMAESSSAMKGGCWARFYDDQNFAGDNLTLQGPVDMPTMVGPFGIDWKGKISSIQTGSKARVLVYDNENFKDLVATVKPGQKVPDVSKKMGFFDEFSSLKIACDGKS